MRYSLCKWVALLPCHIQVDIWRSVLNACFVLAILPSLWLSSHSLHIPAMFSWGGPRGNSQLTLFGHGSGSLRCRWPYQQRRPCLITFSMLDRPYPFLKITLKCFYNLFLVEVLKKNLRNIKLWENLKLVNTTPFDKMKGLLLKENCIHILPISNSWVTYETKWNFIIIFSGYRLRVVQALVTWILINWVMSFW